MPDLNSPSFPIPKLSPELEGCLAEMGYAELTPIQKEAIGPLMAGHDIIAQSNTGSGKTAAFAIPILEAMETPRREIQALVLCPTRELAAQVTREFRRIGRYRKNLLIVSLVGGEPFRRQANAFQFGAHLIVGTPGRVLDHLERKTFELSAVKTVILDEADRMLDMGFRDSIEKVLAWTPEAKQVAFFSATFPPTIEELSRRYQEKPVKITIANEALPAIEEKLIEVGTGGKMKTLVSYLKANPPTSAMIFCNTKLEVDEAFRAIKAAGFSVDRLHGDLEHSFRVLVLARFRNATTTILVSTDIAARGIDIPEVDLVVNFEVPRDPEIYVHRIGRTARAGRTGIAVALCEREEAWKVEAIEAYIQRDIPRVRWNLATPAGKSNYRSMETLYISGGRKQKIRPTDILGALIGDAGLAGTDVGKIEIQDQFTYVAVAKSSARQALDRLSNGKIKGRRFQVEIAGHA